MLGLLFLNKKFLLGITLLIIGMHFLKSLDKNNILFFLIAFFTSMISALLMVAGMVEIANSQNRP